MTYLAEKNILITGAASGIGKLMAEYFAGENCNLALLDINQELLNQTVTEFSIHGVTVRGYACDISDENNIDDTTNQISEDFKQVDILVNNAGIVTGKDFLDMSLQEFRKVLDVNLMGMVMMTKKVLPQMIKRKEGHIVNIASSAGVFGMPKMSEYCASKFADVGLSDSIRLELKRSGHKNIKITVVCPYAIGTGMFDGFKPLFFNPILKPEKVARKVVRAVKKDKPYLFIPGHLKYFYLMKIFPAGFQDWLFLLLGAGRAMENFKKN